MTRMTRLARLGSLLLLGIVACACTAAPERLELDASEAPEPNTELELPDYSVIAEQAPAPLSTATPRLILAEAPLDDDDPYLCTVTIEASGFPAISADGRTILHHLSETPGNGDLNEDSVLWFTSEGKQVEFVHVDAYRDEVEGDCEPVRRAAQAKIDAVHAAIDRQRWRTLEPIPTADDTDAELADRPIDLHWHAGWFYARIPGQRVIEKQAKPRWRAGKDEFCASEPELEQLWFDRETRRALITFHYGGPSCMCDTREFQATLMISEALIDASDELRDVEGC